jgi:hypothetical protein
MMRRLDKKNVKTWRRLGKKNGKNVKSATNNAMPSKNS